MEERVLHVPVYDLAFVWGVGPRIEESGAPYEDVKLKKP